MDGKNISVKAHMEHEDGSSEVRRFGLDSSAATSFTYLQGKLRMAFPSLLRQPMEVAWLDGDQDWVTLSTDEELMLALTDTLQMRALSTLRLKVALASPRRQAAPADPDVPVHAGVCCDSCNETIRGYRYKCLTCEDFDLCAACEAKNGHPEHAMVRISSPELAWQRYVRMGRRGGWRGQHCGRAGGPGVCGSGGFGGAGGAGGSCPWKGRGRQQGRPEMAEDAAKASASAAAGGASAASSGPGQNQQRPKNFFDAINAAMTALGGFPAEPSGAAGAAGSRWSEKSLHELGQKIAACLDPFGIDVDVDVEPRQKASAAKPKTSESQKTTDMRQAQRQTPPQPPAPSQQQTPPPEQAQSAAAGRAPEAAVVTEQPTMMETDSAAAADADTGSGTPIPITVDDNEPTDDWTVVSRDSTPSTPEEAGARPRVYPNLTTDAPLVVAPAAAAAAAALGGTQEPVAAVAPAPVAAAAAAAAPSAPAVDETLEPRIQRALDVMSAMGFCNDGGWLTQLLQAKQGDIGAVLDVLQPVRPRQPQTY